MEFLDIQGNYRVWIHSERVRDMTRTYSQMHGADKYSEYKLNHFASAKWLGVRLRTKRFWVRVQLQSLKLQISRLLRATSSLTFRQMHRTDKYSKHSSII